MACATSTRAALLESHAAHVADAPHAPPPDEALQGATLAERLRAGLDALPDRQRTAISLTRFGHLSHAAAADAMGCSVRTVNNHIVRGLRTLRERLEATDPDGF